MALAPPKAWLQVQEPSHFPLQDSLLAFLKVPLVSEI